MFKSKKNKINLYALWFDVYTGDVYMLSMEEKCFVKIDDNTYEKLLKEYDAEK